MQCSWTYIARAGRPYQVQLYHGTRSGHLVIYVNKQIVLIDFSVRDSKDYSFFIEDDLCHIRLIRQRDRMHYQFEIDKEASTPANERRHHFERQAWTKTLAWIASLGLALFLFVFGIHQLRKRGEMPKEDGYLLLIRQGEAAQGVLTELPEKLPGEVKYAFAASNHNIYVGEKLLEDTEAMRHLLISLQVGDSCYLVYSPDRPKWNLLLSIKSTPVHPLAPEGGNH